MSVNSDLYVIVSATDLSERSDIATPASFYEAQAALAEYISGHPTEQQSLEIVAVYELPQAA